MTDYYINKTSGDDGNAGTSEGAAWKTLAHHNAQTFSANDNIYLNRGDVWRDTLVVPSAGTSGNPITYGAYGTGANPIVKHKNSYLYNHRSDAEYESDGVGHSVQTGAGWARNGDFEFYTGNDFDHWAETVTGTSTVTVDTSEGFPAAVLTAVGGYAQLSTTTYFSANQRFEVTIEAKSDGTGSLQTRFYIGAGGLADSPTSGVYETWGTNAWITPLQVSTTDTDWTTFTATIEADGSDRNPQFTIRSLAGSGAVKVRAVHIRPIWTQYSGDTWMASYEVSQSISPGMLAFDGVPNVAAADKDSVDATNRWVNEISSGAHNYILYVNSPLGNPATIDEDIETIPIATGITTYDGNDKGYITVNDIDFKLGQACSSNFGTDQTFDGCTFSAGYSAALIDSANYTATNCIFEYGNWTIRLIGPATGTSISNCTIRHANSQWASAVAGAEGGGIGVTAEGGNAITTITIENNIIHDCEFYALAHFGEIGAVLTNATYRYNRCYDCLEGFFDLSTNTGVVNAQVYYNLFYDPKAQTTVKTQFDFTEETPGTATPSQGIRHYRDNDTSYWNNTIVGFQYGFVPTIAPDNFTFQNNLLIDCTERFIYGAALGGVGETISNNLYYNTGSAPTRNPFEWGDTEYATFAAYQTAVEATALGSDPELGNVSGFNFGPSITSPVVGAGADLSLTRDFSGHAVPSSPAIGALEYAAATGNDLLWVYGENNMSLVLPFTKAPRDVTPHDTTGGSCTAFVVTASGNVAYVDGDGNTGLMPSCIPGVIYPCQAKNINSTNTTATGIKAFD